MEKYLIDVPVLILFFNRPALLKTVFEQVRIAKPSKLFLYQDGPRNKEDIESIEQCRAIVANINWDCEVHRFYQEENIGCDPSEYISQKWAFSHVDKCIVLEDDDVPSISFFSFCKNLLDKYEYDTRITMISGINYQEVSDDIPYDYFFTTVFSIWGWASWKRVVDQWDETYSFLDDKYNKKQLELLIKERGYEDNFLNLCLLHKNEKKAYYETIFRASMLFNSGLSIVPSKNMINNIGVNADSTHFTSSLNLMPKGLRRIFTMRRFELEINLKHPHYVIENVNYKKVVYKILAWGHPFVKICRSFEELFLNLRYGNFKNIVLAFKKRLKKWLICLNVWSSSKKSI